MRAAAIDGDRLAGDEGAGRRGMDFLTFAALSIS
jgi:hypothetical protein